MDYHAECLGFDPTLKNFGNYLRIKALIISCCMSLFRASEVMAVMNVYGSCDWEYPE